MKRFLVISFTMFLLVLGLGSASATTVILTDGNSSFAVDLTSQAGAYQWLIDGVNQLYQQWFWYRVGSTPQQSLDTAGLIGYTAFPSFLRATYGNAGNFQIVVQYALLGGSAGSGTADVGEQVVINNLSSTTPLDFHFYQYSDFDLNGTPAGQSVLLASNSADQFNPIGGVLSETVITPVPTHYEAGLYPSTLLRLDSGVVVVLNDVNAAGPGDATWAYEWDVTIAPSGSFTISKDKNISTNAVPEPASLVLVGGGLLGLAGFGRRLRK